jgi:hypothetical protein
MEPLALQSRMYSCARIHGGLDLLVLAETAANRDILSFCAGAN